MSLQPPKNRLSPPLLARHDVLLLLHHLAGSTQCSPDRHNERGRQVGYRRRSGRVPENLGSLRRCLLNLLEPASQPQLEELPHGGQHPVKTRVRLGSTHQGASHSLTTTTTSLSASPKRRTSAKRQQPDPHSACLQVATSSGTLVAYCHASFPLLTLFNKKATTKKTNLEQARD